MSKDLKNTTILCVEDDKVMREYIQVLLRDKIKELYFADNGENGLTVYHEKKPDIVMTDYIMPELNGLDMSRKIKEFNNEQMIILVSAFEDTQVLKDAMDIGINGFIHKPIQDVQIFFNQLKQKAKVVQNNKKIEEMVYLEKDKEKVTMMLNFVKALSSQLQEPLKTFDFVTGLCKDMFCPINDQKANEALNNNLKSTQELRERLQKVESLDINSTSTEELKRYLNIK